MAVPNPDPLKQRQAMAAGTGGSRPVPLSSSGAGYPGGAANVASNRPIPLKPRSDDELPDADDDDEPEEESDELREIIKNAPAWLVSTVFHMVLLIVLGLLVIGTGVQQTGLEVEAGYTEDLGKQLEAPSDLLTGTELEAAAPDPVVTTQDLPPVEDPLVAPLAIKDLALTPSVTGPVVADSSPVGAGIGLALSGRNVGSRAGLLAKYGGTKGTEAAVELGLAWLAKQQRQDGSWSLSGPYSDGTRSENSSAATAMALLAFQGHGDTHRTGNYKKTVADGWKALLKMQQKDGRFAGQMSEPIQMLYAHGQCTIAICELYGMTSDSAFRAPAVRAIEYAVSAQDKKGGGWRYIPGQDSDTSVSGWFMMALQSARMAKLPVPDATLQNLSRYLDSASLDEGRRYGYWQLSNSSPAMCAEGLLCRQYLGWKRDDPRLVEGAADLLTKPVTYELTGEVDVYYWYYMTQVAHHMEGEIWEKWNSVMRREIPDHQVKSGPEAGSWDPLNDKWGYAGGRLYVTCLSIYNLEVYYRHLPIYAGYSAIENLPAVPAGGLPDGDEPATDDKQKPADGTTPAEADKTQSKDGPPEAKQDRASTKDAANAQERNDDPPGNKPAELPLDVQP
jgi:hypothetical protein